MRQSCNTSCVNRSRDSINEPGTFRVMASKGRSFASNLQIYFSGDKGDGQFS